MATYLVAVIDVKDVARYDSEYISGVGPLIKKHGGRLLVAEFPNSAAANAWYSDPDYQPLLKIRFESSEGILGFIDGV
jgi:uncharacterized protein (DUF1330 family)